jgi:hypothetical protein
LDAAILETTGVDPNQLAIALEEAKRPAGDLQVLIAELARQARWRDESAARMAARRAAPHPLPDLDALDPGTLSRIQSE